MYTDDNDSLEQFLISSLLPEWLKQLHHQYQIFQLISENTIRNISRPRWMTKWSLFDSHHLEVHFNTTSIIITLWNNIFQFIFNETYFLTVNLPIVFKCNFQRYRDRSISYWKLRNPRIKNSIKKKKTRPCHRSDILNLCLRTSCILIKSSHF